MEASNATPQQKREHSDPHELSRPVPIAVVGLFALLFLWGVYYIWSVRPLQPAQYGDNRTVEDLAAKPAAAPGGAADGAAVYTARCVPCHQAAGTGLPGVFPPLAKSDWVLASDKVLVQILLHGVQGTLTVNGTAYNGQMPPFKDMLNDQEIAAVASHIRSQWGNSAAAIPASTVAAERTATAARAQSWNGDAELAALKK
jgi:mono/diheme cytochrome c family protein